MYLICVKDKATSIVGARARACVILFAFVATCNQEINNHINKSQPSTNIFLKDNTTVILYSNSFSSTHEGHGISFWLFLWKLKQHTVHLNHKSCFSTFQIKTMTGTLRYQFAIITACHLACVLALASEVPHELVRRQADEEASQVVFSNSNPEQISLNGAPSSDPQKVEVRISFNLLYFLSAGSTFFICVFPQPLRMISLVQNVT